MGFTSRQRHIVLLMNMHFKDGVAEIGPIGAQWLYSLGDINIHANN